MVSLGQSRMVPVLCFLFMLLLACPVSFAQQEQQEAAPLSTQTNVSASSTSPTAPGKRPPSTTASNMTTPSNMTSSTNATTPASARIKPSGRRLRYAYGKSLMKGEQALCLLN